MHYAVFADLSRPLTSNEQAATFAALEEAVPASGCVGPQKGPNDEVYFTVDANSDEESAAKAIEYMNAVVARAGLQVSFTISLQTTVGGLRSWRL